MAIRASNDAVERMRVGGVMVLLTLGVACSDVATTTGEDAAEGGAVATSTEPSGPVDIAADGTLPLAAEALDDPDVTTVATDLAPSQVTASTVPEPTTPPPCAPDDVALWTARVETDGSTTDAVIRVHHVGAAWCEPDIGRSPLLDPAIEPDVWLMPGEAADLHVGQMSAACDDPSLVTLIQVTIDTGSIVVPSAVVTCGWWLDAFVPLDPATDSCTPAGIEVSVTPSAVVARTTVGPCRLGDLTTAARADGVDLLVDRVAGEPAFDVLYPGDVAMIGSASGPACDGPELDVDVAVEGVGALAIGDVPCDIRFAMGAAAPWFGSSFGPATELSSDLSSATVDLGRVLVALDPFSAAE